MLIMGLSFVAFGIFHSLTAGAKPKQILSKVLPERLVLSTYRLLYMMLSVLTFTPILVLLVTLPAGQLYTIPFPWSIPLYALQVIGLIGLLISLIQIDLLRFIGIKQFFAYLEGKPLPLPDEPLTTTGFYGMVRHPLYFFGLLIIWPSPSMTTVQLAFNLGVTAYVVIGSLIEERRMINAYGAAYQQYKEEVPWLLPFPR